MTDAELDRLAAMIADAVQAKYDPGKRRPAWLPEPVRPAPPVRDGAPPVWSGAGQSLGDIAPVRHPQDSAHRPSVADLTRATRAAAAGRAPAPMTTRREGAERARSKGRRQPTFPITVPLGVSKRHLHLSVEHVRALFGTDQLTMHRAIRQPGQFAAKETVDVVGPKGRIDAVRVVGPARGETQVELARSDALAIGVEPALAASGKLAESVGGVTLVGPYGRIELERGVIIAARHLHLSPGDGDRWGLRDGDRVDVRAGAGARQAVLCDALVRCGAAHVTELHLDVDEAHAVGLSQGDSVSIIARREPSTPRRRLFTERDIVALAKAGGTIPDGALLTPSARDRARALGLA